MSLVVIYRRCCDACGDTLTPKQAFIGFSEAEANTEAFKAGYNHDQGCWFCPRCQELGAIPEKVRERRGRVLAGWTQGFIGRFP